MRKHRYREPGVGAFSAAAIIFAALNLVWIGAVVGVIVLVLSIAGVI